MEKKRHYRILLISLHADIQHIFKKKSHYEIDHTAHGKEGIELVKTSLKHGRPYSIVYIDEEILDCDVMHVIEAIWQVDKDIQMVVNVTTSKLSLDVIRKKCPTDNVFLIDKPFKQMDLGQLSYALIAKWVDKLKSKRVIQELKEQIHEQSKDLQKLFSLTQSTLESTVEGILAFDKNKKIIIYNKNFLKMWQIDENFCQTSNNEQVIDALSKKITEPSYFLEMLNHLDSITITLNSHELTLKDGTILEMTVRPHFLKKDIIGNIFIFRDLTEHKKLTQKLLHQIHHDDVTGLPNRVSLIAKMENAFHDADKNSLQVGVLSLGMDNFEHLNDSLGHDMGEFILKTVAKRIEKCATDCIIGKLERNEFVIVSSSIIGEEHFVSLANKLLKKISEPIILKNHRVTLIIRIGISIYPLHGQLVDILLKNSSSALHAAKQEKQYTIKIYHQDINKQILHRTQFENALQMALTNNEFVLHYQPIMQLSTDQIIGASALLRWKHPKVGLIYPKDFMPIAEETGLIIPIDNWVLRTACQQICHWQNMGINNLRIAVNVSGQVFTKTNFVKILDRILAKTQCNSNALEIEIAESIVLETPIDILKKLTELRNMGVHLAIDNFSMGYVSLNFLRQLPFEKVKIDRKLIQNINKSSHDAAIVEAFIAMIKNLGLQVLAEGVETFGQLSFLREHTSDQVQGYIINKPFTTEQFTNFLNAKAKISLL